MRIRHIEVFHAVYTYGSVTRAAEMLCVSQPSVSKVLAHAEMQLGFELFERSGGRLTPTPEAERLFEHVSRLFDEIGVVRRLANNLRNLDEGKIRLASTPALGINLVPEVVSTFLAAHPGVYFELETLHYNEIAAALVESRIDIALAFDPPTQAGISELPIADGEFVFIKPRSLDLDIKPPLDLSKIQNLPFIRLNNRGPLGQLLDNYLVQSDASFNIVAATETYHIAHALVARGVGVSIVDQITARSFDDDRVEVLPLKLPLQFHVKAVQLEQTPLSQVTTNFIEHARSRIQDMLS